MARQSRSLGFALSLVLVQLAWAYTPAAPSNSSALNGTNSGSLLLQWMNNGSYSDNVIYQLVGKGSGLSKGVLIHFSEDTVNDSTASTITPWIAFVSCDNNSTNSSLDQSIFDLARSKGAVSALVYSLSSEACTVSPGSSSSNKSDHAFDVFTTKSSASSRLIERQFSQLSGPNVLNVYDSKTLNDSATDVAKSIDQGGPVSPGFLLTTLQTANSTIARNTTVTSTSGSAASSTSSITNANSKSSASTTSSKAMFVINFVSLLVGCATL